MCALARADDLTQLGADEVERSEVVGRVARRESVVDERAVDGTAELLAVVVRAEASRHEAETVVKRIERRTERVGDAALEPAVRTGAGAAENGAASPGSRSASSTPWRRHSASAFAVFPPET